MNSEGWTRGNEHKVKKERARAGGCYWDSSLLTSKAIGDQQQIAAVFGKEGQTTGRIFGCGLEEISYWPSFPEN